MRIARVTGNVTLNAQVTDLRAGSYLVVRTCNRGTLAGRNEGNDETVVLFDMLGAGPGDLVGLAEGREAAAPFYPGRVPYDAYCACILDSIHYRPVVGAGAQATAQDAT